MTAEPLLELRNLRKAFPGVVANDDVSFSVGTGEVHALLGENGAGKSTLVKMIYGVMRPDSGEMRFGGKAYHPSKPFDARAAGIGMVFQHFSLFEALSVAENIVLGLDGAGLTAELEQKIIEISKEYGLPLDPHRLVGSLSVGERQRVEIVRCLLQDPRLLIMDEPTSVLTPQEVTLLFDTLRTLAAQGCSILYISHKLEEIRALCDKATVLRGGKVVASCDPRTETAKSLAEMMIGESLRAPSERQATPGEIRFRVSSINSTSSDPFGVDLSDISFAVRAGEILGIAGVAGNGQNELMEVLSGEVLTPSNHDILLDDTPVGHVGPSKRRALGVCAVPEERLGHGAVPVMSLAENVLISARETKSLSTNGVLDLNTGESYAEEIVSAFNVKTSGVDHAAKSLSGGNLQKFIVGREILQEPKVLIASQPTWGVDAGAAADIHDALRKLAENGSAIIVISQDLDELMALSDRFAVISEGHLSDPKPAGEMSVDEIGRLMGGIHGLKPGEEGASHVAS